MSQSEAILHALQRGERISPLDALTRFGCMRLGARIWELKRRGHNIEVRLHHDSASDKHYAVYSMRPSPYPLPAGEGLTTGAVC